MATVLPVLNVEMASNGHELGTIMNTCYKHTCRSDDEYTDAFVVSSFIVTKLLGNEVTDNCINIDADVSFDLCRPPVETPQLSSSSR